MRYVLIALAVLIAPAGAPAAGFNRNYLVPAVKECPGPAACVPREFESTYTFDTIVLRTPVGRYLTTNKAAFFLDVRGVRDASGALVTGNLTLKVVSGRVSLSALGTLPDDSPLVQVAPVPVPIKNGGVKRFPYQAPAAAPNGTITNGGGVEILDPAGHRLAVVGSQSKP